MQRVATNPAPVNRAPLIVHDVLRSPGQPLDAAIRASFEPRFGQDFSHVRVHTDAKAAKSAQAVNALAYTVGKDIAFGAGQYVPGTKEGKRLMAHELTHVIQQTRHQGQRAERLLNNAGDAAELEAGRLAEAVSGLTSTDQRGSQSDPSQMPEVRSVGSNARQEPRALLQRVATRPRATTVTGALEDVEAQTAKLPKGKVTVGTLAKTEWESLFKRHFVEPDQVSEEVESSHARYLYSRLYGWIDALHFFAHIQFAEESGLEAATEEGIKVEQNQELVRKQVAPDEADPRGYALLFEKPEMVTPSDILHYREDLVIAFGLAMDLGVGLSKQEKELVKDFSDEQIAKLLLDNAMSAWSAEDLVSNQLGVQFFRRHGGFINAGTDPADVRKRFVERLTQFFHELQVVNEPAAVKKLAAKLPGKERWHARRLREPEARKKYPELFEFGSGTHRLRVAIHDKPEDAEKGKTHVAKVAPSVPGLHIEPLGSQFAIYSAPVSHFEAVIMKGVLIRAIPTRPRAVVIELVGAGTEGQ